jgi:hypothetical protein
MFLMGAAELGFVAVGLCEGGGMLVVWAELDFSIMIVRLLGVVMFGDKIVL